MCLAKDSHFTRKALILQSANCKKADDYSMSQCCTMYFFISTACKCSCCTQLSLTIMAEKLEVTVQSRSGKDLGLYTLSLSSTLSDLKAAIHSHRTPYHRPSPTSYQAMAYTG